MSTIETAARLVRVAFVLGFILISNDVTYAGKIRLGERHLEPAKGVVTQGQAHLTYGKLGEDHHLTLDLGALVVHRRWRLAFRVPLRFRVIDAEPKNQAVIRREDWDTPSDFSRLIPLATYGQVGEPFYVRWGTLSALSIGHGTLVERYTNGLFESQAQGGLYLRGDLGVFGSELVVDDLLDPELSVLRLFSKPFSKSTSLSRFWRRLSIGLTVGGDFGAPLKVKAVVGAGGDWALIATDASALGMIGGDLGLSLVETEKLRLGMYLDVNSVDFNGVGVHTGLRAEVRLSPLKRLKARAEYRLASGSYRPGYVSSFYEAERLLLRGLAPKLALVRAQPDSLRHGFAFDASFEMSGLFHFEIAASDLEGANNTDLMMKLTLTGIGDLHLSLYYASLGAETAGDLFDLENAVFAASARYHIGEHFFIAARLVNDWWVTQDAQGAGQLQTVLNYDVGVGTSLQF